MCFFINYLNGWIFSRLSGGRGEEGATSRRKHKGSQKQQANGTKPKEGGKSYYESNILSESFTLTTSQQQDFKNKQLEKAEEEEAEEQLLKGNKVTNNIMSSSPSAAADTKGGCELKQSQEIQITTSDNGQQTGIMEPELFKIRALNRRHLDFDNEYDLGDVNAKERSRWSGPFHFIQAADSQFGMIDSYIYNRTEPGWKEEIKLCEQLVDICNQMEPKPKFMIICGDLADAWPRTEIRRQQVVDFKRIFSKLDTKIPLVCVCGNHDVGDEPTMSSIEEYRQNFGDDYFHFTLNDVLFIVINSQFYQHREHVKDYANKQDEWLESMLAKCKLFKYSIVFEHIPWFLKHSDEEDDYFNIRKEVRLTWLKKFKEAGVTKIMCGHYHRNAGGWYEDMELVVTSAIGAQCGSDTSGVRVVKVLERTIEHQYYAMQDIPQKISLS